MKNRMRTRRSLPSFPPWPKCAPTARNSATTCCGRANRSPNPRTRCKMNFSAGDPEEPEERHPLGLKQVFRQTQRRSGNAVCRRASANEPGRARLRGGRTGRRSRGGRFRTACRVRACARSVRACAVESEHEAQRLLRAAVVSIRHMETMPPSARSVSACFAAVSRHSSSPPTMSSRSTNAGRRAATRSSDPLASSDASISTSRPAPPR